MRAISKTFRFKPDIVEALENLVSGRAPSMTALIEELVRTENMRLEMQREEDALDQAWRQAMGCPEYRAELHQIQEEFGAADEESAREIG